MYNNGGESKQQINRFERKNTMWSIWNAPSDLDYYGQSGFSGDEPEEEQETEPEPPKEDEEIGEPEIGPELQDLKIGEKQ